MVRHQISKRTGRRVMWISTLSAGASFFPLGVRMLLPWGMSSRSSVIPPGTVLTVRVTLPLSSQSAHVGDKFEGEVISANAVDRGLAVLPRSRVEIQCVAVRQGEGKARPGYMRLTLSALHVSDGHVSPIETTTLSQWGGERLEFGSKGKVFGGPEDTLLSQASKSFGSPAAQADAALITPDAQLTFVLLKPAVVPGRAWDARSAKPSAIDHP